MSRKRYLPRFVADVNRLVKDWTAWEGQGFRDEIVKATENILHPELRAVIDSVLAPVGMLDDMAQMMSRIDDALPPRIEKAFQEKICSRASDRKWICD